MAIPAGAVRKVLIVSTVELPPHAIDEVVGTAPAETLVVVPAVRQSKLQWLTNEEDDARAIADDTAAEVASATPGDTRDARHGDSDPILAIEDALREFDATELVVVTQRPDEASWLERRATEVPQRIRDLPLTLVVLG